MTNKSSILNIIKDLIREGDEVLKTEYSHHNAMLGISNYVDDDKFQVWKEKIGNLLSSNINFSNSLESFNQNYSICTNLKYAKQYYHILVALKDSIEKNVIKLNNDKTNDKLNNSIFVGHGRSKLWYEVVTMLNDDCGLNCINYFEKKSQAGRFIGDALRDFQNETTFAIIVMTAEDETKDNKLRARQNVIHEIGFFQGKLGFEKVAILKQKQVESFTNIDGLQYIEFDDINIDQTFYKLRQMLVREHII